MSTWAVLLAAGRSARLGRPKQFLDIGGERAVDRVVRTAAAVVDGIVLVLPPGIAWDGVPVDAVAAGGATRAGSVRAGLALVPPDATTVVIHDAAHPLATPALFAAVVERVAAGADAAVCVLPMTEVVGRVSGGAVVDVLAKHDQVVEQSPAAFRAEVLRAAHAAAADAIEDVGEVLRLGARVVTVPGDPVNIHVTTRREWQMAVALAALTETRRERTAAP